MLPSDTLWVWPFDVVAVERSAVMSASPRRKWRSGEFVGALSHRGKFDFIKTKWVVGGKISGRPTPALTEQTPHPSPTACFWVDPDVTLQRLGMCETLKI